MTSPHFSSSDLTGLLIVAPWLILAACVWLSGLFRTRRDRTDFKAWMRPNDYEKRGGKR